MEARLPVANGSVVETDGYCARCGKFAELGDGLCVDCWDRKWRAEELIRRSALKEGKKRRHCKKLRV